LLCKLVVTAAVFSSHIPTIHAADDTPTHSFRGSKGSPVAGTEQRQTEQRQTEKRQTEKRQTEKDQSAVPTQPLVKGRTAFVSVPRALVHSGPAEEFYPTHQLQQGAALEVFHRTDTGWVAIRPPAGSFSWIPAAEVFLLPGGRTAEVTSDNSVSWIGTALGTAKQYRWQVRLNKGEQITVLGEQAIKDHDGRESLWYKISPPSGEFRWISSGMINSEPPSKLAVPSSNQDSEAVVPASATKQRTPRNSPAKASSQESKAIPLPIRDDAAAEASDVQPSVETDVQAAGYEGIIVHGNVGEEVVMDGEVVDAGIYYDDSGFEDDIAWESESVPEADASWDDWQLFEFTDEGLRFPLWERSLAKRANLYDPLLHDPFSLAMAPKVKGPRLRSTMHEEHAPASHRRRTPWRDPRMLAEQRLQGYPQASGQRGSGTSLSALREAFNATDNNATNGGLRSQGSNGPSSSPDYYRDQQQPRQAPSLDQSSATNANRSGLQGLVSGGWSQTAAGFNSGTDGIAGANLLGPPGLNSDDPSNGNWLSRNWQGLQQQALDTGTTAVETGSAALMHLQFKLNEIVTQPMMQWNFGSLKSQVQQLIQAGPSPVERGQARLLLERIEAFEQLATRSGYFLAGFNESHSRSLGEHHSNMTMPPINNGLLPNSGVITASFVTPARDAFTARRTGEGTGSLKTSSEGTASSGATAVQGATLPFDATGWLVPVYATTAGQPSHAITDDSGRIVAYVTGLPGMNLDRYVNQAIGIHGLRGFLPQFQAAHIEAQNVVRIR